MCDDPNTPTYDTVANEPLPFELTITAALQPSDTFAQPVSVPPLTHLNKERPAPPRVHKLRPKKPAMSASPISNDIPASSPANNDSSPLSPATSATSSGPSPATVKMALLPPIMRPRVVDPIESTANVGAASKDDESNTKTDTKPYRSNESMSLNEIGRVDSNDTDWVVVDNNASTKDDNRIVSNNDSLDTSVFQSSPMSTSEDMSSLSIKSAPPPPLPAKRQRSSGPLPPPGLPPKPNGGSQSPTTSTAANGLTTSGSDIDVQMRINRRPLIANNDTTCRPVSQQFTSTNNGERSH